MRGFYIFDYLKHYDKIKNNDIKIVFLIFWIIMNKNYTIFLILSLLGINIVYGMENNALNIQNLKKDIPGEYKKAIEDDQYGYIYGSSYVITHKGLRDSLEEREKNGAHVELQSG